MNDDPGVKEFNLRISLAIVLFLAVIIFSALYYILVNYRDVLKFVASLIGGATAIYAAYYAAAALRLKIVRDKMEKSFEILQRYNDTDISRIIIFIEQEISDKNLTPNDIVNKVKNDPEIYSRIRVFINVLEDASIAIQCKYVDEKILYKSLASAIPYVFKELEPYIRALRIIKRDDELYIEIEKLAHAWMVNIALTNGKKFT